jgi:hypothetical protein
LTINRYSRLPNGIEKHDLFQMPIYLETQGIILQLLSRFLASADFQFEPKNVMPSKISNAINHVHSNLQQGLLLLIWRPGPIRFIW